MTPRFLFTAGALTAGLAVMTGAFGAHGLKNLDYVTPERLETFETAVRYQMYHALGLLFVGWVAARWPEAALHRVGLLFLTGMVLFSGSLYILVLTGTAWLGAITPLGGVAFIAGWIWLALSLHRQMDGSALP